MEECKNIIKLFIYYISFIFFSISSIIALTTYDKVIDMSTGSLMSIVITGSIVGQEIYGSLKKDNEHGMVE